MSWRVSASRDCGAATVEAGEKLVACYRTVPAVMTACHVLPDTHSPKLHHWQTLQESEHVALRSRDCRTRRWRSRTLSFDEAAVGDQISDAEPWPGEARGPS